MEETKPVLQNSLVSFHEKHSFGVRIWHWISYFCITSLFLTVIAASYLFNTKDNIPFVEQNIHQNGGNVSTPQAKALAHAYNDKVWNWHSNIGLVLSGLFLFRLIVEIFLAPDEKFFNRLKRGIRAWKLGGPDAKDTRHYMAVKFLYTGFYALLTVVVITGLILSYADKVAFFKSIEHTAKNIHNFCMYLTITFIILHIGGVIYSELGKNKGIVSEMINGGKSKS